MISQVRVNFGPQRRTRHVDQNLPIDLLLNLNRIQNLQNY